MPHSLGARQQRAYIVQRKATTIALGLVSALGLAISIALTPASLADIEKTKILRNADGLTQGKVIAHRVLQEKRTKRNSSLTVAYTVNRTEFQTHARGYAALPESTPIGSLVEVRYLTTNPAVSEVITEGLRPERYSWLTFALMWSSSVLFLTLSVISYKHLVGFKKNV